MQKVVRSVAQSFAFPLPCRLEGFGPLLAGQTFVGQPSSGNLRENLIEPIRVRFSDAIIKSENLLVNVLIQMDWFDADVCSAQTSL
jgi:hypothetical protein